MDSTKEIHFIVPRYRSKEFDITGINDWTEFLQWLDFTERSVPHIKSSAQLLTSLGKGFHFRLQQSAVPADFQRPSIGIEDSSRPPLKLRSQVMFNQPTNIIGVSPISLNSNAGLDIQAIVEMRNRDQGASDGLPSFRGRLLDLYFLAGVEETDHAIFFHGKPELAEVAQQSVGTRSIAEYNAQDHELQSLLRRIEAAKALSMPEITIQLLRQKCNEALAVRESRGHR